MHRYGNPSYVLNLDAEIGVELILKAKEKERDDRLFLQWAIQLPIMAIGDKAESFEDYKKRATGGDIDLRPIADILKEIEEAEKSLQ